MGNFSKSMLSLMKYNFNEMKKMIGDVDFEAFEKELNDCKNSLVDSFNDLKSKIVKQNGKFVIEVPYDRDNQVMFFSVKEENGNIFSVEVKPCEDCEESMIKSTFSSTTTLPKGVLTERIVQNYNQNEKKMFFEFETNEDFNEDDFDEVEEKSEEKVETVENTETKKTTFEDVIDQIVEMHRNGASFRKIAKEFGISDKTVAKWIRKTLN